VVCNTYCFPQQQWLSESASILRYTHIACLFLYHGNEYVRASIVIGRCAAIDVVRSTARSPALTRNSRDRIQLSERCHRSLCINAAASGLVHSTSGFLVQLDIPYFHTTIHEPSSSVTFVKGKTPATLFLFSF
jgi:hypothetical protein